MASDYLICGTPKMTCGLDEYPQCPQSDFSSAFDAWGWPDLKPTGIITEGTGGELAAAQLDSYVLHSLSDGEQICYKHADVYGRREWFVHTESGGFVGFAVRPALIQSSDEVVYGDEVTTARVNRTEAGKLSFPEGVFVLGVGLLVLYTLCKSIIDAVEEGQRLEALKPEEGAGADAKEERQPFVARPNADALPPETEREPWKTEKWFDGLSDVGRREVEAILEERIPHMLGDPVFRADYVRDGRITAEGVRAILAGGGINYTSVGSLAVTRAMETKAEQAKVTPIDAGRKAEASPKRGRFGLFELFKKAGR